VHGLAHFPLSDASMLAATPHLTPAAATHPPLPLPLPGDRPPTGGELESVTNSGSGTVVLGPGLNTSSLRITASRVGEVRAINITANSLTYTGSG
jgi:hypothetical protein